MVKFNGDNTMNLNEIYELIAQSVESGLNQISTIVKFDLKTSYNVQMPQIKGQPNTIYGVMNFTNNNVAPIENLEVYTLPASISFFCAKEWGNEVQAIINAYIAANKGLLQTIGEYTAVPTFSTPSASAVMLGQEGEALRITFYAEYPVFSGLLYTNQITYTLDGAAVVFDQFGTGKSKATNSDNIENTTALSNVPITQSIAFSFNCFITTSLDFILQEIYSTGDLTTTHTLVANVNGTEYTYTVVLVNGEIKGVMGGALVASLNFAIYDGGGGSQ